MLEKNNISWRHHFLPKFYIKNFCNEENRIWVFDKRTNRIQKKPKPAKSIFFESNRNTVNFGEHTNDFIEEFYGKFDSDLALIFNKIQITSGENLATDENFVTFLYSFITWLYWRIPSFDKINIECIKENYAFLRQFVQDKHPTLFQALDSESIIKLYKSLIPFLILQKKHVTQSKKLYYGIYECEQSFFLLSDNPMVVKKFPGLENIINNPVIIPISHNKLYFNLDDEGYQINMDIIKQLNLILMFNSNRYFASPNKEILTEYIEGYQIIKEAPNMNYLIEDIFNKINKRKT